MKKRNYGFRKGLFSLLAIMAIGQLASAQVGVGITTPDPSAQLQIESTNKGILIPRVTSTSVVTTPANGLMVYQTGGTPGFYYNSGTALVPAWVKLAAGSVEIADGTLNLSKLSLTGAASGQVLRYDGTALVWATPATSPTGAAGGDLTGTYPNPTVANSAITSAKVLDGTLVNSDISATAAIAYSKLNLAGSVNPSDISPSSATSGQVIKYDGSNVVWGTATGTPSGSAGGDLTGTYPNPTVANSSITSAKVLDGTLVNSDISATAAIAYSKLNLSASVVGDDLVDGTLTLPKLNTTGATDGQIVSYSSTEGVKWVTPSGGSSTITRGYAANTSGSTIAVLLGGTDVPLPNAQQFSSGISVNGSNTQFTFSNAGAYMITYHMATTANLLVSTRLLLNGASLAGSVVSPVTAINYFSRTVITNISAGSVMSLQFYGLLGAATLTGDASVSIIRLQ